MHFSVPDTQELYAETTGYTYTAYNIYINGNYHTSLRYKQLHGLHESLRRQCSNLGIDLPAFPPKKFLPLTNNQVESRRAALEQYLQLVGQDSRVSKLELLQKFWLRAQLETALTEGVLDDWFGYRGDNNLETQITNEFLRVVTLEILLPNDYHLQINCSVADNASSLLEKVATCLNLPSELLNYFCLFLVRYETQNNTLLLLRKLMDFESAFVSRVQMQSCQIQLRKSYWNPNYDFILLKESTALNLLYMQTVAEIEREWIIATPGVVRKLCSLREHGLKREYIEVARRLPLYGCLQFLASEIDYPEPETTALIAVGNKELSIRTMKGDKIYETKFRVTRMRCWRVTTLHNMHESKDKKYQLQLQFSFEYLMSKENLRWITITSEQAMLISVCLQAMVDELLNYKSIDFIDNKIDKMKCEKNNGMNETNQTTIVGSKNFSTPPFSSSSTHTSSYSISSFDSLRSMPLTFLSQRILHRYHPKVTNPQSFGAVSFRNTCPQRESVQNAAFDDIIGDDDL